MNRKREILKRTVKYVLLGKSSTPVNSKELPFWYGMGQHDTAKEVRKQYRHAVKTGWAKFNLKMVKSETVISLTELRP